MTTPQILLLGAIAGATIFLGLPIGRMRGLGPNARAGLSSLATGILVFLFWDVMTNAVDPIDASLQRARLGHVRRAERARCGRFHRRADEPRLLRRVDEDPGRPALVDARRAGRGGGRRVRRAAAARSDQSGDPALVPDRDRHRRAQLRRGARDRAGRGGERDRACGDADHRLRAAQRDRGVRDLRPAERRRHRPELEAARPARPDRRRAHLPRHRRRAGVARATPSRSSSSPSPAARSSTSSGSCSRSTASTAIPCSCRGCSSAGSCSASRPTSSSPPPGSRARAA